MASHQSESPLLKSLGKTNAGESVEKGTLPYCWWEFKLVQSLWKTIWRFPEKLKICHMIQQSPSWAYTQTKL